MVRGRHARLPSAAQIVTYPPTSGTTRVRVSKYIPIGSMGLKSSSVCPGRRCKEATEDNIMHPKSQGASHAGVSVHGSARGKVRVSRRGDRIGRKTGGLIHCPACADVK